MMEDVRPTLTPMPSHIARLPVHRGYPVPWFVAWLDGVPEFRVADPQKFVDAVRFSLCWVCGTTLGANKAFPLGPMCAINRNTTEPPSHTDCARWSIINCPFLSNQKMVRREKDMPEHENPGGCMIKRNPGLVVLWVTKKYRIESDGERGFLITVGEPHEVECYKNGREAALDEVAAALTEGMKLLGEVCETQEELDTLTAYTQFARQLLCQKR